MDYFKPADRDGLSILWGEVYDHASLRSILKGMGRSESMMDRAMKSRHHEGRSEDFIVFLESPGGMLVIPVTSREGDVRTLVVEGSMPELSLQHCLDVILASRDPWGIYLRVKSQTQLATSLHLLREAYASDLLYHPVWINMDLSYGVFDVHGYITGPEFVRTINQIFPYVTMAPSWPQEVLDQGYTPQMVEDMMKLFGDVWQDVSLQLLAVYLERSEAGIRILQQSQERFSLTVEHRTGTGGLGMEAFTLVCGGTRHRAFFNIPKGLKGFISQIPKN